MPKEKNMKESLNALKSLGSDLHRHIGQEYLRTSPDMPLKKMAELAASSKTMHDVYQPVLDEAKLATPLLKAVVEGNPEQLITLIQIDPQLLFKKGQIKDPAGQVFYNVSAYQMMKYLCDDDMLSVVMPIVPEEITNEHGVRIDLKAIQKEQSQHLRQGGADLIKLNFDPTNLPDFDRILQHTETYTIHGQPHPVTLSLLENPDAILYYKDADGNSNWYYANQETKTIDPIQPQTKTKEDAVIFSKLKKSMDAMEDNSARRSNDIEHDIIKKSMQKSLVRNGIQYEQDGQCFCDTHHDFNRYSNAYRKCDRLYSQRQWADGDKVWCKELGHAQKEVMWLLQRYCEENRLFFPLPDFKSSPFRRSLQIVHWVSDRVEDVYSSGHFVEGFGSDFAVYKGGIGPRAPGGWSPTQRVVGEWRRDLIAVSRLVEDAKANVIELKPNEVLSRGPGMR